MAERVRVRVWVRKIDDDEGRRLLRIVRGGTGSVMTWRRAQMVLLLSAQGMSVAKIAKVTFTSAVTLRAHRSISPTAEPVQPAERFTAPHCRRSS